MLFLEKAAHSLLIFTSLFFPTKSPPCLLWYLVYNTTKSVTWVWQITRTDVTYIWPTATGRNYTGAAWINPKINQFLRNSNSASHWPRHSAWNQHMDCITLGIHAITMQFFSDKSLETHGKTFIKTRKRKRKDLYWHKKKKKKRNLLKQEKEKEMTSIETRKRKRKKKTFWILSTCSWIHKKILTRDLQVGYL